ncbi:MAG TPA: ABC transporter ATP-binding protein [Methanocorpusculum sp.]|nr:ABC transporter ATP-binding protein [Methanocorpusculum sp.]
MNISVEHICQNYGNTEILHDVSFATKSGEVVALLGPNGSGKSTLIKTIAGILDRFKGDIKIDGLSYQEIEKTERAKMIGYVPQYFHYTSFTSVLDTVLIGRRPYMSWSVSDRDLEIVDKSLEAMNISDLATRYVNELSGGQRQRVFIARALAQEPSFFLFDEPTSSLDLRHQLMTLSKMRDIVHENKSGMIIALHDLNLALRYCDKVLMLKNGSSYAFGTPNDVLTPKAVRDVYGVEADVVENERGRFILAGDPAED